MILASLLMAPAAAAEEAGLHVAFAHGSRLEGSWTVEGLSWAVLVFAPGSEAAFSLPGTAAGTEATQTNRTLESHRAEAGHWRELHLPPVQRNGDPEPLHLPGPVEWSFRPDRLASLVVVADTLRLGVPDATGSLHRFSEACGMDHGTAFQQGGDRDGLAPVRMGAPWCEDPLHPVVRVQAEGAAPPRFVLEAEGIWHLEWHGAGVECVQSGDCPEPGHQDVQRTHLPGRSATVSVRQSFIALEGGLGAGSAAGTASFLVAGGAAPGVLVDGAVRLYRTSGFTACDGHACYDPEDRTLTVTGAAIRMEGLRRDQDAPDRYHATVSGHLAAVRLDEARVPLEALLGAPALAGGAALAVGGLMLFKSLVAPLLTRPDPKWVLQNPNRRTLYAYIQENPGPTFRELLRGTGIASGTARHHLGILKRAGLLMEQRHRSTLRYFENHGRYEQDWDALVLLRETDLRRLHAWIGERPGSVQKDILDHAFTAWGWSRSTTQHRLQRLLDGGLLEVAQHGRYKRYTALRGTPRREPSGPPGVHGALAAAVTR